MGVANACEGEVESKEVRGGIRRDRRGAAEPAENGKAGRRKEILLGEKKERKKGLDGGGK